MKQFAANLDADIQSHRSKMRDVQLCEQPLRERGQLRNRRAHADDLHRPLITWRRLARTTTRMLFDSISRPFDPFTDRALSPQPARVQEFCEKEFHRRSAIAILNQVPNSSMTTALSSWSLSSSSRRDVRWFARSESTLTACS